MDGEVGPNHTTRTMQRDSDANLESMKRSLLFFLALFAGILSALSQGLFESSLSGNPDESSQRNLSIGGFIRSSLYLGNTPVEEKVYLIFGKSFGP